MYFEHRNKQHILVFHGGDVYPDHVGLIEATRRYDVRFRSGYRDWKSYLPEVLGDDFEVLQPQFPSKDNASLELWNIVADKLVQDINDRTILIGHSLGASFALRYLINNPQIQLKALILVAPSFDQKEIFDFCPDMSRIKELEDRVDSINVFHSEDDPYCPYIDSQNFESKLNNATLHTFQDRGHFNQAEFPEIIECIKELN